MTPPQQIKRSITISGHRTSISLEQDFWESLKEIASTKELSISQLVQQIDGKRLSNSPEATSTLPPMSGLSSSIRVYILDFYKERAKDKSDD